MNKLLFYKPVSNKYFNILAVLVHVGTSALTAKQREKYCKRLKIRISVCCNGATKYSVGGFECVIRRGVVVLCFYIKHKGYIYPNKDYAPSNIDVFKRAIDVNRYKQHKAHNFDFVAGELDFLCWVLKNNVYLDSEVKL